VSIKPGQVQLNYTRLFSGTYIEKPGDFNITPNNLAPASEKLVSPRIRRDGKYDLDQWNDAYFEKLKSFIAEAGRLGIVVEMTLFCSTYSENQWSINPFNEANNLQNLSTLPFKALHTLESGGRLPYQEKLVRKMVRELNSFPNLFFEIQNEPWSDQHVRGEIINPYLTKQTNFPNVMAVASPASITWQRKVASWIADEEKKLPNRHMITQNIANFRHPIDSEDIVEEASIFNFHYAYPDSATWNLGWNRVVGYDETGFAGGKDTTYRRQAWNFIMAGGGLFNSLDYSFSVGFENGTDHQPTSPGGGGVALRKQLRILKEFLETFTLQRMHPDNDVVVHAPGFIPRCLCETGRQYAIYLESKVEHKKNSQLTLKVPHGKYEVLWIHPASEREEPASVVEHSDSLLKLTTAEFTGELAFRLKRIND
jgi:hypothetical protein